MDKLAHQSLTGGDIAVSLHKHAALYFPASFLYAFFDLFINLRCIFLYIFVELRLTGHEDIFRISAHKLQYSGKASHSLILRNLKGPQPCTVYMGMSHTVDIGITVPTVFVIKFPGDILLRRLQTLIILLGAFLPEIQQVQGFIQAVQDGQICLIVLRQKLCHLIGNR